MKLLLDQGLPRSAAGLLRARGLDVAHVGELGLSHASDSEILEVSRQRGAVVVTLDADFHALLAHAGATSPSVIRLRVQGYSGQQLTEL